MPSYATTWARDATTGQILFDVRSNPVPLIPGGQSALAPEWTAVVYYRDGATGQTEFDGNGYPLPFAPSFWSDGGVLAFLDPSGAVGWPTSPAALVAGSVWYNGGTVAVVAGGAPGAPLTLAYPQINPAFLLETGGASLPTTNVGQSPGTLWNNGGVVSIS